MSWNAAQYSRFEAERNRPIHDLLAQLPRTGFSTAFDLGCGPGNSTELLQRHLPEAAVTGLDSSHDMLEAARKRLPNTRFLLGDIATWQSDAPPDLIFANASLQWIPDHAALLPRLAGALAPGGRLAVQVPDNLDEPAHRLMREVASADAWAAKLAEAASARAARHAPEWYIRTLRGAGLEVDLWRTTYHHQLAGGLSALVEWFKGTGLRPFLQPLSGSEQSVFLARYEAALAGAYPVLDDGGVVLPFPRLFFVARRPET